MVSQDSENICNSMQNLGSLFDLRLVIHNMDVPDALDWN
jgi:hypothetical protein